MLTGNKGEWSEIYVFLKLLADGKLNAADANLEVLPDVFFPIIKILRNESGISSEYKLNGNIKIIDGNNQQEILNFPVSKFIEHAQNLLAKLRNTEGRSFSYPELESFLVSIKIHSLTALKTEKKDIIIVVHDLNTGQNPTLGFSIKSMLGGSSTLFNAGTTTNFIFELQGTQRININEINSIEEKPKICKRISFLKERGYKLVFNDIQSKTLKLNLQLIDSDLPSILAECLIEKYSNSGLPKISDVLSRIKSNNPLKYDLSKGHPFYEYKIKNFLTDSALGMTPAVLWTGQYDATGGIIIVKQSGELVCYHIYNRYEFQNYLLNNTRFEQASTSRYNFGNLYEENNKIYMKLNLQVRFIS